MEELLGDWDPTVLGVLKCVTHERVGRNGARFEPGEVVTLWVVDIDGTVVVIHTRLFPSETTGGRALAGPSAAALADFAAVLDPIRIERG